MPSELDPEILRVLRFLLHKAESPSPYVEHVEDLYRPTKDFRVLECLADGVPGHSAEAVYAYLEASTAVVGAIHEEATCDALAARLATLLANPATATTATDRRALRLLLVAVETSRRGGAEGRSEARRAGAPGPRVRRSRAALVPGRAASCSLGTSPCSGPPPRPRSPTRR